jgi:hypothetical protein
VYSYSATLASKEHKQQEVRIGARQNQGVPYATPAQMRRLQPGVLRLMQPLQCARAHMHRLQPSASVHGGAPCVRVRVRVRNAALVVADMATCGYPPPLCGSHEVGMPCNGLVAAYLSQLSAFVRPVRFFWMTYRVCDYCWLLVFHCPCSNCRRTCGV